MHSGWHGWSSGLQRVGSAARRRIGWTVGDQILSAGTNFALSVVVARSVEPRVFGAFSIAYVTYLLWRGLTWALCAEPFMIRFSAAAEGVRCRAAGLAIGASAGLGVLAGLVTAAAGVAVGADVGLALLALSVVLPALLVQEAVRSIFFGLGRPQLASVNDLVWGVAQLVGVVALLGLGYDDAAPLLLAWGASAAIAAVVGLWQLRLVPDPRRLLAWVHEHRSLGPWLAMEFLLTRGASQVTFYVLGWVASLDDVASVRAAQIFVGPLSVIFAAAQVSMVSEGARIAARSVRRLRRVAIAASSVLAVASAGFGFALWFLPEGVGQAFVGANWADARPLLPIMAVAIAGRAVVVGAAAASRAMGEAKRLLATRAVVAPVSVLSGVVGAAVLGAVGAAISFALTAVLSAVLYWRQFLQQVRQTTSPGPSVEDAAPDLRTTGELP